MGSRKSPQANQHLFAQQYCSGLKTYIEIGGNSPTKWNNTFILEKQGWEGYSIEYDKRFEIAWKKKRKNKIYFEDAMTFDYKKACVELGIDTHIGYLSCDIEPAENTFKALQKVLQDGISFNCITFEHDNYQSETDYDKISREFLVDYDYFPVIENVYPYDEKEKLFETWYLKGTKNKPIQYSGWPHKWK